MLHRHLPVGIPDLVGAGSDHLRQPATLIMNFAAGENLLARMAQLISGQVSAITATTPTGWLPGRPAATAAAPTAPVVVPVASTATPVAPVAAPPAPVASLSNPLSANPVSAPVEVPSFIGGRKIGPDAQRVTRCLFENRGDRYICGMQELNGGIAKCVGGIGTARSCFTAPLTRQRSPGTGRTPTTIRDYCTCYYIITFNIY